MSVGIDPNHIWPTATVPIRSQWAIGDIVTLTILLCDSRTNRRFFINHMKWNCVGRDRSRSHWIYRQPRFSELSELYKLTIYKCEIFSLKNNICVWSSIDRRFFKCLNQSSEAISVSRLITISSISLYLFDLAFERPSRCETERLVDHFEMCIAASSFQNECHQRLE